MDTGTTYPPEMPGGPRRGLFARRSDAPELRRVSTDPHERAVEERLEEGLRAIEEHASTLMREIASEMWRASGTDMGPEQDRILSFISRDQAIRSLIASSDDRFQVLAVRTARLEDALAELAENGRLVREAIQLSARSVHEIANSPTLQGVELVRTQLEQVEAHIASTFQHMDERDQALTGAIKDKIVEHGDLIAHETARIVEAMESYVQGGAEAMGRLAQRIEQHAAAFAAHDDTLADKLRATVADETREMAEQVQMLGERVGIQGRTSQEHQIAMENLLETRVMGLAQLTRSDSQALRELIDRNAAVQEERLTEVVNERMSSLTLAVSASVEQEPGTDHGADRVTARIGGRDGRPTCRRGRRHRRGLDLRAHPRASGCIHHLHRRDGHLAGRDGGAVPQPDRGTHGRARRRGTRGAREDDPLGQPGDRRTHVGGAGRDRRRHREAGAAGGQGAAGRTRRRRGRWSGSPLPDACPSSSTRKPSRPPRP